MPAKKKTAKKTAKTADLRVSKGGASTVKGGLKVNQKL